MLARWMGKNKMVHIMQNQLVKKGAEKMKSSAVASLLVSSFVMYVAFRNCVAHTQDPLTRTITKKPE